MLFIDYYEGWTWVVQWQHVIMDIGSSEPQQTGVVGKNVVQIAKDCNTYYRGEDKGQYILKVYEWFKMIIMQGNPVCQLAGHLFGCRAD